MKDITPRHNYRLTGTDSIEAEYRPVDTEYRSVDTEEVELRYYLDVLIKQRRLLIFVFSTVLIIGAYFSFTATPLYQASAILKIEPQNPSVTGVGEMLRLSESVDYDYYQTQFKLLQSNTLAAKVITDLKLSSDTVFTSAKVKSSNPADRVTSWVLGKLSLIVSLIPMSEPKTSQSDTTSAEVAGNVQRATGNGEPAIPQVEPWLIDLYNWFLQVRPITRTRLVEIIFSTPDLDCPSALPTLTLGGLFNSARRIA